MHDFIIDKCELILESISAIQAYLIKIKSADDFKTSFEGNKTLDAVMMRLQSVGENIKKINKTNATFFENLLFFDTNNIIRFRDFISHHYEKLDSDIVLEICKIDIPLLKQKIQTFLSNNNETV